MISSFQSSQWISIEAAARVLVKRFDDLGVFFFSDARGGGSKLVRSCGEAVG